MCIKDYETVIEGQGPVSAVGLLEKLILGKLLNEKLIHNAFHRVIKLNKRLVLRGYSTV
jgi:hypothetical protein